MGSDQTDPGTLPPSLLERKSPWVQLKYFSFHPCIYPAMIREVSPDAKAGSLVSIYDKLGQPFGVGLYNPKASIPLRVFFHGAQFPGEELIVRLLDQALALRLDLCAIPNETDAFRVIHSDGDGLSGLVIDRFADVLSIQVHSLGIWQRLAGWLPRLHERLGTREVVLDVDPHVARLEKIPLNQIPEPAVKSVRIREHGIRYEVDFARGHKTGFFCDQRDNRHRLARMVRDQRVLDLCCYTGGFSLAAKVVGRAAEVTGVDLDESAVALAKRNANLNQARISWVHCDAFSYARQMQRNQTVWDTVILDPPKLVMSRDEFHEGARKYEDLNRLGISLVRPGGTLVTCSCSGLLALGDFEEIVTRAAHRQARRLQIFDRTGPGPDHPVMSNCPEGRYLKVIWARVV